MNLDALAWKAQFASCLFMAGVISVIQAIHYPSFMTVERGKFPEFHAAHSRALSIIAAPAMIIELLSAILLARIGSIWVILNLCAVVALWALTFFVSVPIHNRLAAQFEKSDCLKLAQTNWPRTILWLFRAAAFVTIQA